MMWENIDLPYFCESGPSSIPIGCIGLPWSTGCDVKKCLGRPRCSAPYDPERASGERPLSDIGKGKAHVRLGGVFNDWAFNWKWYCREGELSRCTGDHPPDSPQTFWRTPRVAT